jgi:hypothetical protein
VAPANAAMVVPLRVAGKPMTTSVMSNHLMPHDAGVNDPVVMLRRRSGRSETGGRYEPCSEKCEHLHASILSHAKRGGNVMI